MEEYFSEIKVRFEDEGKVSHLRRGNIITLKVTQILRPDGTIVQRIHAPKPLVTSLGGNEYEDGYFAEITTDFNDSIEEALESFGGFHTFLAKKPISSVEINADTIRGLQKKIAELQKQ